MVLQWKMLLKGWWWTRFCCWRTFRAEYLSSVETLVDAHVSEADFHDLEPTLHELNANMSASTNRLIREPFPKGKFSFSLLGSIFTWSWHSYSYRFRKDSITPDTQIVLSNVIYILWQWLPPFIKIDNNTPPESFFINADRSVEVSMMKLYNHDFEIVEHSDLDAKAIFLPLTVYDHHFNLTLILKRFSIKIFSI